MPLETLDRSPPPFFKQGPSALSQLVFFSALALFLMVADARFHLTDPLRKAVGAVLYPVQWLMLQPVELLGQGAGYFEALQRAQQEAQQAREHMVQLAQRANQAADLLQENTQLRQLLAQVQCIKVVSHGDTS